LGGDILGCSIATPHPLAISLCNKLDFSEKEEGEEGEEKKTHTIAME